MWGSSLKSMSKFPLKFLFQGRIPESEPSTSQLSKKGRELFEEQNVEELKKFYKKSPPTLAHQYIYNPESLSEEEKDRLIWEASHKERDLIAQTVQPNDPVLVEIINRLSIKLKNGLSLL